MDLGRDAHLGDLVEDFRRDRQEPDQRRAGARAEHDLQAPLEGEHLRVEPRAGDDVGQQVLDVVEDAGLGHRVRQVEDLLLEQELLFVVEHGGDGSTGRRLPASRSPARRGRSDQAANGPSPSRSNRLRVIRATRVSRGVQDAPEGAIAVAVERP